MDDLDHLPSARAWRSIGIFVIGVAIVALVMAQISLPGTRPMRVAIAVAVVAVAAYLLTYLAWPRHRDTATPRTSGSMASSATKTSAAEAKAEAGDRGARSRGAPGGPHRRW